MKIQFKKGMVVVHNDFLPFGDFGAIFLFGILFVRSMRATTLDHESIHFKQWIEVMVLFTPLILIKWWFVFLLPFAFYLWYIVEWLVRKMLGDSDAYYNISFEKDAYTWQGNPKKRKMFNWIRKF